MLKVVASGRRKPGMTRAEFVDYIVNVHGGLARAKPIGLARYVQNHVVDAAFSTGAYSTYTGLVGRDNVTELYFASPDDMKRTFTDDYTVTVVAPDGRNFADAAPGDLAMAFETILLEPAASRATTKIMQFLYPAAGASLETAKAAWDGIHAAALASNPAFAEHLLGLSRSDAMTLPAAMAAHFGTEGGPAVALIISLWIPNHAIKPFRGYEAAILRSGAFDTAYSYFLLCEECQIYPQTAGHGA